MSFEQQLSVGADGADVGQVQLRLQHLGYYPGAVDQSFGEATDAALRAFQQACGLAEDGVVSAEAWELLDAHARQQGYDSYAPEAAVGNAGQQDAGIGELSPDGQWQWDGAQWQPARVSGEEQPVAGGQLSEDGQWQWDGERWVPVAAAGDAGGPLLAFGVPDPAEWRDLARQHVPFDKWTREQKLRANEEHHGAVLRLFGPNSSTQSLSQHQADLETLQLLHPYAENFRSFVQHLAGVILSVSPFEEAPKGKPVTLSASVTPPVPGRILFRVTGSFGLQQLGERTVANGAASLTISSLPKGPLVLSAEYPTQNVAGLGEIIGATSEIRYTIT